MSPVLILAARTHRLHTRNPINNANVYYVREREPELCADTNSSVCVCDGRSNLVAVSPLAFCIMCIMCSDYTHKIHDMTHRTSIFTLSGLCLMMLCVRSDGRH
jgi:hypothetical protein